MKKSVVIPFCGFYESAASYQIDQEIESAFQYNDSGDSAIPDRLYFEYDYSKAQNEYVKLYVDAFNDFFLEETGLALGGEFETMESPREYNFTTDRIFVFAPYENLKAIYNHIMRDDSRRRIFADTIKARHTSCDGFISFYKNDLSAWTQKPLREYDHNELQTVIIAALHCEGVDDIDTYSLMENDICNGRLADCADAGMTPALKSFSGLQYDAQRELDYEAVKDNPEYESYIRAAVDAGMSAAILDFDDWKAVKDNPDFIVHYRCANTPDMFKTKGV